jgi:hypothetical protein
MKKYEQRFMVDDETSECDFEGLRGELTALQSTYQERIKYYQGMHIVLALKRRLRPTLSAMNFEGQSGSIGGTRNLWSVSGIYITDICEQTLGAIGSRACRWSLGGTIWANVGSHGSWVDLTKPEMMRIALFNWTSMLLMWTLFNQTGAQYSAVE